MCLLGQSLPDLKKSLSLGFIRGQLLNIHILNLNNIRRSPSCGQFNRSLTSICQVSVPCTGCIQHQRVHGHCPETWFLRLVRYDRLQICLGCNAELPNAGFSAVWPWCMWTKWYPLDTMILVPSFPGVRHKEVICTYCSRPYVPSVPNSFQCLTCSTFFFV